MKFFAVAACVVVHRGMSRVLLSKLLLCHGDVGGRNDTALCVVSPSDLVVIGTVSFPEQLLCLAENSRWLL